MSFEQIPTVRMFFIKLIVKLLKIMRNIDPDLERMYIQDMKSGMPKSDFELLEKELSKSYVLIA